MFHILVVDDDKNSRLFLTALLEEAGAIMVTDIPFRIVCKRESGENPEQCPLL